MTGLLEIRPKMARFALTLLTHMALIAGMVVGCKTDTTEIPGEKCVGGFIRPETGECEAKCDETKCKPGNKCVDNRCSLLCDEQRDCANQPVCNESGKCYLEAFKCAASKTDTDEPVNACVSLGARYSPVAAGYKCPLSWTQCFDLYCPYDPATQKQLRCDPFACDSHPENCQAAADPNVGTCSGTGDPCVPLNCDVKECKTSLYCPNGLQCDFSPCGGDINACKKKCSGDDCNVGECEGTGEPCIFNTCAAEHCKALTCLTKDEGDATAYCAQVDCAAPDDAGVLVPDDDACPGGFYCGAARDRHDLCGPSCSGGSCNGGLNAGNTCMQDGDCQNGNDNVCGLIFPGDNPVCIDAASTNTAFGTAYFEGGRCLLRHSCVERNQCAPCESNVDCTAGNANVCIELYPPQHSCVSFCETDANCTRDHFCADYKGLGGATATCENAPSVECVTPADCPDGAACVARRVCIPKSGPCRANPSDPPDMKYCRHCVDDTECGDAASGWACVEVSLGEFACLDMSLKTTCTNDQNCPTSPGGAFGKCLDENVGVDPASPSYHTCYAPFRASTAMEFGGFTCYP